MFRARIRPESISSPTAPRGSVGTAKVWDASVRASRGRAGEPQPTPAPAALAVGPDELASLVAGIVQLTLDTRFPGCTPARRLELAATLEARLLTALGAPAAPPHAPLVTLPAPPVRSEVTPARVHTPAAAGSQGPATPLGILLEDRLRRLGGALAARADLRQRLIALAQTRLESDPPESAASSDELRSLDVLQRRAAKLERSLREARAALAYVSGLEHVDMGLASIYRVVQGLAPDDPQLELKRGALEGLFQANLALQKSGS